VLSTVGAPVPNPRMLVLAREHAGLTQVDLARVVGVSQGLVSHLEHGHHHPGPDQLRALAAALEVPVEFLGASEALHDGSLDLVGERSRVVPMKPLRRAVADANVARLEAVRLVRSVDGLDFVPSPSAGLPAGPAGPEGVAARLRAAWGVPPGPVEDLTALLERAGTAVSLETSGPRCLGGILLPGDDRCPDDDGRRLLGALVALNDRLGPAARRWVLARLLARHTGAAGAAGDDDLDAFAASFLMPLTDVAGDLDGLDAASAAVVGARWGVPAARVVARARALGRVPAASARRLRREIAASPAVEASVPEQPRLLAGIVEHHRRRGRSDEELCAVALATPGRLRRLTRRRDPGIAASADR
jgi:transcriptional regulator with XRE-family HTH domain